MPDAVASILPGATCGRWRRPLREANVRVDIDVF